MTENIHEFIDNIVKSNDVVLFMKGTAESPKCGYSAQVVKILNYLGVDFLDVDIMASEDLRQGIKDYTDWPTTPQLYIKQEFIGGCDIVTEMFQNSELQQLLKIKNIKTSKS